MSFKVLKEEINKKIVRNLYLFYGPEEYMKNYYLEAIEKHILEEQFKNMNKVVLEGKPGISRIMDNCETMPFFSDKKLVIAKNTGLFKSSKGESGAYKDFAKDNLQNLPEHACLIFYEEEIDKRLKTVDIIKKNGLIVEFEFQQPAVLIKWIIKVFKTYNKEINPFVASQIVEYCEPGMIYILNEIEKVISYMGDREVVTSEDLDQVCSKSVKSRVFDLTDAISVKNPTLALKLLEDIILLKEPILKIIFMITRQFRQILEIKLLLEDRTSIKVAASKVGVPPYIVGKISKQANNFSVETLKKVMYRMYEMDEGIKTGKIKDRIAVELIITEFCK